MKNLIRLALGMVLCSVATPGGAQQVTFDPFPPVLPPGVTIEYFDGGMTPALAVLPVGNGVALASASSAIPGGGNALLLHRSTEGFGPYGMLVSFASPVLFFSAIGNDFGGDEVLDNEVVYLHAFDIFGSLVATSTFSSPWANPNLKPISIDHAAGFSHVAFTWTDDLGYYAVDDLDWRGTAVVPEPVTMVLLGSGLLGIAFVRRRRLMPTHD
jgi:hypothetical protein